MTAPTFRRPRQPLSLDQIDVLVVMRDQGATWREVGKVVGKQDCACKRIYDRAVRERQALECANFKPGEDMDQTMARETPAIGTTAKDMARAA